jgi:hypothetical protein
MPGDAMAGPFRMPLVLCALGGVYSSATGQSWLLMQVCICIALHQHSSMLPGAGAGALECRMGRFALPRGALACTA